MNLEWMGFLNAVRDFVSKNPEAAPHIASFVQAGLEEALGKARERASDMEVALVCATSPGFNKTKGHALIRDKLAKWKGQTSCNWDWLTDNQNGDA